jgi:hypothetical protein
VKSCTRNTEPQPQGSSACSALLAKCIVGTERLGEQVCCLGHSLGTIERVQFPLRSLDPESGCVNDVPYSVHLHLTLSKMGKSAEVRWTSARSHAFTQNRVSTFVYSSLITAELSVFTFLLWHSDSRGLCTLRAPWAFTPFPR